MKDSCHDVQMLKLFPFWYWWTYLQGRNRDTGVENGRVDVGEGEDVTNWEITINMCVCVYTELFSY